MSRSKQKSRPKRKRRQTRNFQHLFGSLKGISASQYYAITALQPRAILREAMIHMGQSLATKFNRLRPMSYDDALICLFEVHKAAADHVPDYPYNLPSIRHRIIPVSEIHIGIVPHRLGNKVFLIVDAIGVIRLTKLSTDQGIIWRPDELLLQKTKKVTFADKSLHIGFSSHCIDRILERFFQNQKVKLIGEHILCTNTFMATVAVRGKIVREPYPILNLTLSRDYGYFPLVLAHAEGETEYWAIKSYLTAEQFKDSTRGNRDI